MKMVKFRQYLLASFVVSLFACHKVVAQGYDLSQSIEIVADDIDETGTASAYIAHTLRLKGAPNGLTDPKWELLMPLKNGEMRVLGLNDDNLSCIVPAVADESLYDINADGDIHCTLSFSCTINGKTGEARDFAIFLSLKPSIDYVSITKIVDNSPYSSYDAYYEIQYHGAEMVVVSLEEEYGSFVNKWYVKEPHFASGVVDHITAPYHAWIDFTVENQYGKAAHTIELEPYGANYRDAAGIEKPFDYESGGFFRAFDIYGNKIIETSDFNDIITLQGHGLVLVQHLKNGIELRTFKLYL